MNRLQLLAIIPVLFGALVITGCTPPSNPEESASPPSSGSEPEYIPEPLPDSPSWESGPVHHASGRLRASFGTGQRMTYCFYVVEREGKGTAVVTVTMPDDSKRKLFFTDGRATGSDIGDTGADAFSASKSGTMNIVRAGSEVYAVPDLVIYGG